MGEKKRNQKLYNRWISINSKLAEMGCPGELPKIRPYQDGANEVLRIIAANKNYMPFYMEVSFEYLKPYSGEKGVWHIRFNRGMIVIPVVDGYILLKREHRPTMGAWTWELPRAFVNLLSDSEKAKQNPGSVIAQILKSEAESVLEGEASITEISQLHEGVAENTGTNALCCPVYLVKISGATLAQAPQKTRIAWEGFSPEEAAEKVVDMHSMSAFFCLNRHLSSGRVSLT